MKSKTTLFLSHCSVHKLLYVLFCLNSLSCIGQNKNKNGQTPVPSNVQKDSTQNTLPYWKLLYEKQVEISEPYHTYGKHKLRWQGGTSYYCESRLDSSILRIKEDYPGILIHQRIPVENTQTSLNTVSLEFYEIGSKKLKSMIDLEKITPYNSNKYKNIEIGSIDYEYDEIPGSAPDCNWPGLPSPDTYRTYNSVYSINPTGYVCVGFILVKVHTPSHYIVGWEQTFVILNPDGEEIYRSTLNHDTPFPYISPDGKYLAYSIGSETSSNPFEPCQKAIEIHEIQTRKRIYEYKCGMNQDIGFLDPVKNEGNFIATVINRSQDFPRIIYELLDFDLNEREVTTYKFLKKEDSERYWKSTSLLDRKSLLKLLPFQTSKF